MTRSALLMKSSHSMSCPPAWRLTFPGLRALTSQRKQSSSTRANPARAGDAAPPPGPGRRGASRDSGEGAGEGFIQPFQVHPAGLE